MQGSTQCFEAITLLSVYAPVAHLPAKPAQLVKRGGHLQQAKIDVQVYVSPLRIGSPLCNTVCSSCLHHSTESARNRTEPITTIYLLVLVEYPRLEV